MSRYTLTFAFILARDPQFWKTELYREVLQEAIDTYGFKPDKGIPDYQEDCTYDFILNTNDGALFSDLQPN